MEESTNEIITTHPQKIAMIWVENVFKSYGKVKALSGLSLAVGQGEVLALLGPNGAGKTTLIRILTTLLSPDSGRAIVGGFDVTKYPSQVRGIIGLAGQYAAVDENLTGQENLELVGRLYHLGRLESRRRARELLEHFELDKDARRLAKTYSGGMRRRLDLAASLVGRPQVLFLDEPTTGLDPPARVSLWKVIKNLVREGTTLLLTTQHMEEADELAHRIAVIDKGLLIAQGSAKELKARVGGNVLELHVVSESQIQPAAQILYKLTSSTPQVDLGAKRVSTAIRDGTGVVLEVMRQLDAAKIAIADIALHQPTLDDVFLTFTGHSTELSPETGKQPAQPSLTDVSENVLWQRRNGE